MSRLGRLLPHPIAPGDGAPAGGDYRNNAIRFDLWQNPAVEGQATGWVYRIGQPPNVQKHRFTTRDTFEERTNGLIHARRTLADLSAGTGEKWIGNLCDKDLKALLTLAG